MELKIDSMENAKKVVEACLEELMKKSDLTPAETKALLDGLYLHDELCCRIEDCKKAEDYPERGYSRASEPYREYHITSYGMPERSMYENHRGYGHVAANSNRNWYDTNDSMRSMRGSYCDDPYYYGEDYSDRGRGYSRHSISDRVVSMVEKMMDTAKSDYERQELEKYIRTIRAMGMND